MTAPEEKTAPLLRADGLGKTYGHGASSVVAVADVSFDLPAGGSLGIVGESGSGKTTVAKMLVGIERPTTGRIWFEAVDRTSPVRGARARQVRARQIQIVFQDPYTSLDPRQSGATAITAVLRLHTGCSPAQARTRTAELGELVGLDARQLGARPRDLSGGQRQRVAIARALAAEPRLLILDESVAALDVSIQAQILNLLADIREQTGIAYLLISHDLAVVRQLTDDVIVMRNGHVIEAGPTATVLDHPDHEYTRRLRDSVPRAGWHPSEAVAPTPPTDPART